MTTIEFASMLAEWRERNGYSDKQAAAALGTRYGAFLHWFHGEYVPGYFTLVAVLRQIRDGHDPLADVQMTPAEFADALKSWRGGYGFTQRQAGVVIGCSRECIMSWEQQRGIPQQPGLAEILRRLRMPVDVERVREATRITRPIEPEAFATRLREWRRRHRLTQTQAASFLSTTARTIWVWEKARSLPNQPLKMLAKLAECPPPRPKPVSTPLRFGKLLRQWRKARGLNQLAAARALDVGRDQAKISKWEHGKGLPVKAVLVRLLEVLGE